MRSLIALVVATQVAHADPASDLFDEGRALLADDHVAEACAKFDQSIALDGQALGTMLNLGLCNEQLDRLATALRWYRRVQARAIELANSDAELAARAKTIELAAKVPTLRLVPDSAGAVTVDGARIAEMDYPRVELDAGAHVVAATGAVSARVELKLADGDHRDVPLALKPPPPPPPMPVGDRHRLAYVLGGVGAGLLAVDLVVGLVARSRFDATDVKSTRDAWRDTMRYGGTSVAVLGAGAIAAAIYLYLHVPEHGVVPVIAPNQVGMAVAF